MCASPSCKHNEQFTTLPSVLLTAHFNEGQCETWFILTFSHANFLTLTCLYNLQIAIKLIANSYTSHIHVSYLLIHVFHINRSFCIAQLIHTCTFIPFIQTHIFFLQTGIYSFMKYLVVICTQWLYIRTGRSDPCPLPNKYLLVTSLNPIDFY